jgi:hypothetical protein
MSYMTKFVAALIGLLAMAIVASRQLFLFTAFRSPQGFLDLQGGRYHLWLAASAGITACITGGLMFHFFLRHEKQKWSKIPLAPGRTLLTAIRGNPSNNSVAPAGAIVSVEPNPWLSEGQADDRRPMSGSVAEGTGTHSAQRASARRSHQVTFKKWSQARHD